MCDLFWPSEAQMARRQPYSLKPNGKPRVLSGIIFMNRKGSRWRDASKEYGPHKTPHTRWKRWSGKGIFEQMMAGPAAEHGEGPTVTIDATCLTAHRTASSPGAEKGAWPPEWTESEGQETVGGIASPRTRGRNQCGGRAWQGNVPRGTRLHALCARKCRPISFIVSSWLGSLPSVKWLLGDRGCGADWFREALKDKGIRACIVGRKQRKTTIKDDGRSNRNEIMFRRLKDWRPVATRNDRCPKAFFSAIAFAVTVI
ncbi:transposase [Poseidonocella sp. HB161398]|uniref:transposase n=1 Tax=Poseidonocella sp. HB161398 TaxID=2320855 RepID=UPI0035135FF7